MKEPFLSDWVALCTVPFVLRTSTVAPAIAAPDMSTTVPDSCGGIARRSVKLLAFKGRAVLCESDMASPGWVATVAPCRERTKKRTRVRRATLRAAIEEIHLGGILCTAGRAGNIGRSAFLHTREQQDGPGERRREGPRWYDAFENRATSSTRFASKRMLQFVVHGESNTLVGFVLPVTDGRRS
jgi:hypothetical protein